MMGRFKCQMCKHFQTDDYLNDDNWKCDAFPNGIPDMKIAFIRTDPCTDCNNGIGFERAPDNFEQTERSKP